MGYIKTPGMVREIVTICPKHKAEIARKHKDTMFYIVVLCDWNVDL